MKKNHIFLLFWLILSGCVPIRNSPLATTTGSPKSAGEEIFAPLEEKAVFHPVRVAIAIRQPTLHLRAPDDCTFTGIPLEEIPPGNDGYREGVLASNMLSGQEARIESQGDDEILVNGKSYHGSVDILEEQKGTLTVVNELSLEDYVMGVLAGEVPRNWPLEALKAQAIAARTFAVFKQAEARRLGKPYDFENNALFQMYQGSDLVNENIKEAVAQSRNEIITYKSSPILAFFHSNCGGKTANSLDVFKSDKPYLKSVSCSFGTEGAHYQWRAEVLIGDLVRKLRKEGLDIADVVRIRPVSRDESGRILVLAIMDSDGRTKTMKASDFRMKVGPDIIRSTRFDAEVGRDKVVFNGRGWGHGVGLCQEGAYGMAMKGYQAFDILRHYYQGIMVEKIKE
jgi:stage II sporulation protein D